MPESIQQILMVGFELDLGGAAHHAGARGGAAHHAGVRGGDSIMGKFSLPGMRGEDHVQWGRGAHCRPKVRLDIWNA